MPSKRYLFRWICTGMFLASWVSCASYSGKPVSGYRGDGTCTTIVAKESVIGYLITRGYRIDFGRIDFGNASEVTYSIDKLPSTREQSLYFGLHVTGDGVNDGKDIKSKLHGQLSMRLQTRDGKVVFNCTGPIEKWRVTGPGTYRNGVLMYWSDASCDTRLKFEDLGKDAGYSLLVKYEPAPQDAPLVGVVQAEAGGYF